MKEEKITPSPTGLLKKLLNKYPSISHLPHILTGTTILYASRNDGKELYDIELFNLNEKRRYFLHNKKYIRVEAHSRICPTDNSTTQIRIDSDILINVYPDYVQINKC